MVEYDYSKVMELYKRLETMGLKNEADSVMGNIAKKYPKGTSAPPNIIQQGLEGILATYQPKTKNLAATGNSEGRMEYIAGLAAIVLLISYLV